jgi:hypothetical protein
MKWETDNVINGKANSADVNSDDIDELLATEDVFKGYKRNAVDKYGDQAIYGAIEKL